ncbi:MAG: LON peptidase substrate-binding domain-containing protein [Planctomycetota bacterium]|jgi:ATP-dependent Lon protease
MSEAGATQDGLVANEYPAIQIPGSVVFPNDVVSIQIGEEDAAIDVLERAPDQGETVIATVFTRDGGDRFRTLDDLEPVGVLCRVVQHMRVPSGGLQVVFQGLERVHLRDFRRLGQAALATVIAIDESEPDPACARRVVEILDLVAEYLPREGSYPDDLETILRMNVKGPGKFADLVAAYLHLPLTIKREVAARSRCGRARGGTAQQPHRRRRPPPRA